MKEQKTVNPGYSTKATTPFVNYFLFILPQQQDSDSFHQRIARAWICLFGRQSLRPAQNCVHKIDFLFMHSTTNMVLHFMELQKYRLDVISEGLDYCQ